MPAKRVLISVDERLLSRIDQFVARQGLTRSGYLAQLASADIEADSGPGDQPAVAATLRKVGDLFDE
jgi:hypothetical protein